MKKLIILNLFLLAACSSAYDPKIEALDQKNNIYKISYAPDYRLADAGVKNVLAEKGLCPAGYITIDNKDLEYSESPLILSDALYRESIIKCK